MTVFLDTGVLSLATHPQDKDDAGECKEWLHKVLIGGHKVVVPEIVDYELRRELLRSNKKESINRLDAFNLANQYLPLSTEVMRQASIFWAKARNIRKQTAADNTLDSDMILCAQVDQYDKGNDQYCVATTNVKHISLFVEAREWLDIPL